MNQSIHELHRQIEISVATYQRSEAELLELLSQMDGRHGYLELGYASLFEYCTRGLKLTESQASAFIAVGRRSRLVPALKEALASQTLSVSKAKRITRVIAPGNAEEWIKKAATLSQREIELEVARFVPATFNNEFKQRLSEKIFRLTMAIRTETLENFEAAQALLEKSSLETTLEEVLKFFLEKKDPLLKAKRAEEKREKKIREANTPSEPVPTELTPKEEPTFLRNVRTSRKPLPAFLQHQVQLRDNGHCQHRTPEGRLCGTRRYLHIHHRVPVSQNGSDTLDNIELLCSAHHRLHHFKENGQQQRMFQISSIKKNRLGATL